MRLQKRLLAWEPDDRDVYTTVKGETLGLSLHGPGEGRTPISLPVALLPWPQLLSVQPIDERMTPESLPQLDSLMHLTKPAAMAAAVPAWYTQIPH